MTSRRTRRAIAVFLAAILLAGCAGAPELDQAAAGNFQSRVATAKQLTAQQDFAGALAELGQLERDVQAAADQGDVSPERRARIESAISKVRADLEAAVVAAEPAPAPATPAPVPSPDGGDGGKKGKDGEGGGKGENKGDDDD